MLKGKDLYVFVRFGGLDLKNQKGFKNNKEVSSYHSPPAKRGFYAMPKIAQTFFLLSSLNKTQTEVFSERKLFNDYNGEYWKKTLSKIRKEFRKDRGYIWHHLIEQTKPNEIISQYGSWVKTDIRVWATSLSKLSTKLKYGRDEYHLKFGDEHFIKKGIIGNYSKDILEVFFDEKI